MAGSMIEPIATTVAGEEPETAANSAQATTAGEPEAAIPMTDHRGCKRDHPPRDTAMGEEIAGQNEERDRHDLEAFDAR